MRLETKRLILRKPRLSDWKDIYEGCKDLEVSRYLSIVPHPYTKKDAISFIKDTLKNWNKKKKSKYIFFIELKSEKKIIGVTDIHNTDKDNKKVSTGSWIAKKYWRKGYIKESKIAVIDFIFDKLKFRKIETEAFIENQSSNSMQKKLGFKKEGIRRKSITAKSTGKIHDSVIYRLFKREWKKIRAKLIKELNKKLKNDNKKPL